MNGSNTGGGTASSGALSALTSKPWVWEAAFIFALLLLIFAHKITVEGLIEA